MVYVFNNFLNNYGRCDFVFIFFNLIEIVI